MLLNLFVGMVDCLIATLLTWIVYWLLLAVHLSAHHFYPFARFCWFVVRPLLLSICLLCWLVGDCCPFACHMESACSLPGCCWLLTSLVAFEMESASACQLVSFLANSSVYHHESEGKLLENYFILYCYLFLLWAKDYDFVPISFVIYCVLRIRVCFIFIFFINRILYNW